MARKKISEFRAKQLLYEKIDIPYNGITYDASVDTQIALNQLDPLQTYVLKIDEGVKKRMKQGLVVLHKKPQELLKEIQHFHKKGYRHMIIEPFVPHSSDSEKYLSLERTREGIGILYSEKGGIDIEENQDSITRVIISRDNEKSSDDLSSIAFLRDDKGKEFLKKLLHAFDEYYFSFLEINPLVIENGTYYFLDVAAEVDSAAEFFVHNAWKKSDMRAGMLTKQTEEEIKIAQLAAKSQASFTFTPLNLNGAIFMLLSGGGASIVLADEVYNHGFGKQLANYGEYSGNPNTEEVYVYTKQVLSLLLQSDASKKVLVIGGGVANFTDIRKTFQGIIKAITEQAGSLRKQQVKIFVRRGGPHQEEGLALMEAFLKEKELYGIVTDQRTSLPEIIEKAIHEFAH